MSVYLENPMDSNENLIETAMEFRKVARYIITPIKTKMFIRYNADLYERSAS